jgi:UDP-glucuronate 4-epimerase
VPRALITGGAGFIGSHLVDRLLAEGGWQVTVLDSFEPFYDPALKEANVAPHLGRSDYRLVRVDLRDREGLARELEGGYEVIVHLAARAGVRPSLEDPVGYQQVNVMGTQYLLELAKDWGTPQFVFASSSSVYGVDPNVPWREDRAVTRPISPYASTKVSGELLGHVYAHLYGIRFVALRFFTVFGPRQRPDLAIRKFAERILRGEPIPVFGDGSTRRDYTYVDDTIRGVRAAMDYAGSGYEVINLGNDRTITLARMIEVLEAALEREATLDRRPDQPGDVPQTWADVGKAERLLGYRPTTSFETGVQRFVAWLRATEAA